MARIGVLKRLPLATYNKLHGLRVLDELFRGQACASVLPYKVLAGKTAVQRLNPNPFNARAIPLRVLVRTEFPHDSEGNIPYGPWNNFPREEYPDKRDRKLPMRKRFEAFRTRLAEQVAANIRMPDARLIVHTPAPRADHAFFGSISRERDGSVTLKVSNTAVHTKIARNHLGRGFYLSAPGVISAANDRRDSIAAALINRVMIPIDSLGRVERDVSKSFDIIEAEMNRRGIVRWEASFAVLKPGARLNEPKPDWHIQFYDLLNQEKITPTQ